MHNRLKNLLVSSTLIAGLTSLHASADTLQQIFDLALTNDPQIRAAEAQLKANQEQKNLGKAGILPSISLSGSYSDSSFSPQDNTGDTDTETTSYSANLSQALFDLPAWYSYKSGDAAAKQAEQDYLSAKQDLVVRTVTSYFNVLSALDTMEATKAEEVALASQLEQTQQRYEVGLIAVTDVHEAQAAYDDVVARLVNALGNVGIAFENLTVLTNQSHASIAPLKDDYPITSPVPETAEDWVELALANSFDLKSATLSRDSADYNAQSKKWEHLPSLRLGLSYTDSDEEIQGNNVNPFNRSGETTSVSLSLDVPLYLGGSVSASRRQAYYQFIAAEENLNSTQRLLVQNTRNQHLTVQIDVAEANARRQAITSSESAYEATKAGYDVGTRNLVDVLNAEQGLYQARRNYANARYDYIVDLFSLNQLAGALTTNDVSDLNIWLDASMETPRSIVERSMPGMPAPSVTTPGATRTGGSSSILTSSSDTKDLTPEEMLQQWAADWSELKIADYIDHYGANFEPRGQLTSNWRNEKRDRLSRLNSVSVALSNVDVIAQSDTSATVLFDQSYVSSDYSDQSEKEVVLTKENGRWKIASEKALSVTYN